MKFAELKSIIDEHMIENHGIAPKPIFSGIFVKGIAHTVAELKTLINSKSFYKTDLKSGNY